MSNLLVWGLVSGLFVASASQCGSKNRGRSTASVGDRPEKVDVVGKKADVKAYEPDTVERLLTKEILLHLRATQPV